jgi:hypothetical protein
MPRNPIDYSKTVFYKIVCKDISIIDLYVGSTTAFKARKHQHKSDCKNEKRNHLMLYQFIGQHGGWENWDMVVISIEKCADSLEAHMIERKYMESLSATLNCIFPSRTREEWIETNKDKIKEQVEVYKKLHKQHINEWLSLYRETNKETIAEWQSVYRETNKDKIKEQRKQYREANKDAIKASKKLSYEKNKILKQQPLI